MIFIFLSFWVENFYIQLGIRPENPQKIKISSGLDPQIYYCQMWSFPWFCGKQNSFLLVDKWPISIMWIFFFFSVRISCVLNPINSHFMATIILIALHLRAIFVCKFPSYLQFVFDNFMHPGFHEVSISQLLELLNGITPVCILYIHV